MTRGIVNPWRVHVPLKPAQRQPPSEGRINLEDVDLEADIRPSGFWVLRARHACIRIDHPEVENAPQGLYQIVAALMAAAQGDPACAKALAPFGLRAGGRSWNAPAPGEAAGHLDSEEATIWFRDADVDEGVLDLVRRLGAVPLRGRRQLRPLTPMLR